MFGALEDIFHSSAILGVRVQGLSRSTVEEGSGSFCVGFWRVGVRRGVEEHTGDREASVLGAQASGSGSRFPLGVSCFLCRPTHPPLCCSALGLPSRKRSPPLVQRNQESPTLLDIPLPKPVMCHSHTRGCQKDGEAQVSPDLLPAWPFSWAEWDPAVALTGRSWGH